MRYLIFTISLVIFSANIKTQTFSFYRTSPAVIYSNDTFGVISYAKINNLTGSLNRIRIIRSVVNVPMGWESCLCDIVMCHPPGIDTAIANYPPGISDLAVMLYAHSIPGTGYVTFRAEKVTNTNEHYNVTFGGAYNPIGIQQISSIADKFSLSQNYPNPFNPTTKIKFSLPSPSEGGVYNVTIDIYDLPGRKIASLIPDGQEGLSPGTYEVEFDGTNYSSGIYYYRLMAGDYLVTRKMVLVK